MTQDQVLITGLLQQRWPSHVEGHSHHVLDVCEQLCDCETSADVWWLPCSLWTVRSFWNRYLFRQLSLLPLSHCKSIRSIIQWSHSSFYKCTADSYFSSCENLVAFYYTHWNMWKVLALKVRCVFIKSSNKKKKVAHHWTEHVLMRFVIFNIMLGMVIICWALIVHVRIFFSSVELCLVLPSAGALREALLAHFWRLLWCPRGEPWMYERTALCK